MAKVIKLRKGLDLNIKGRAAKERFQVEAGSEYALVPDDFTGMKPKVVVREQDTVKVGSPLFVDKNHPEVNFVSPVSGKVTMVERGARRKVLSVRVEADKTQSYVEFGKKVPAKMDAEAVKDALLKSGLFAFFKQRPYDVTANPADTPRDIFVSAFNSMPLAADFEYVLQGREADFQTGLDALSRIAKTHLGVSSKQTSSALTAAKNVDVTIFDGPAPAGNVGVQINHVAPINKGEMVWTIGPEEVIFIGHLFNTGRLDFTRVVAFAGSEVKHPAYCEMTIGQKLDTLIKGNVTEGRKLRIINGNVMTGMRTSAEGFLAAHATEVNVIPEGDDVNEFMGWIMPRFNDFSVSRSYCSWLMPGKQYTLDARVKGSERHMIMSGEYDRVFPMDIFPEQLVKAVITGDIDRMEALGIYEVAPEDFALCEFVDSSKLELQRIIREGLDMLRKEMA